MVAYRPVPKPNISCMMHIQHKNKFKTKNYTEMKEDFNNRGNNF